MGHANPSITLNIYSHLFETVNKGAALRFENIILESNSSKQNSSRWSHIIRKKTD
jgi:hypothetical protein